MSDARQRFVRLAEARTNKVLKDISSLSNLSNRSNYSYTQEDVKKIFSSINAELKAAQVRFETSLKINIKDSFTLD